MSIANIFPLNDYDFNTGRLIDNLTTYESEILLKNKVLQYYKKGETIFREGNYASGIYWVVKGIVKKYKMDSVGIEQIFYLYGAGEIFGYHAILSGNKHADATSAISDTEVYFIPRNDFFELLDHSPSFSRSLLKVLSHEFDVLANMLTLHNQRSLRERLVIMLVTLREKFKPSGFERGDKVEIRVTRVDLAAMLGTAKESVVRLLRNLKEEDLIVTRGNIIEILDVERMLKTVDY